MANLLKVNMIDNIELFNKITLQKHVEAIEGVHRAGPGWHKLGTESSVDQAEIRDIKYNAME